MIAAVAIAGLALVGCADSIRPEHADAGPPTDGRDGTIVPTGKVTTVDRGDGSSDTLVDATSIDDWTGFDLDTGAEATGADTWDLGLRRASIRANGGVSGAAGVEVAILTGVDFAGVVLPPTAGYLVDLADGDDDNTEPDYVMRDWYDYDVETHVLTPKSDVYAVRTSAGAAIKLEVLEYYDPAGTSAWYLLHWALLDEGD